MKHIAFILCLSIPLVLPVFVSAQEPAPADTQQIAAEELSVPTKVFPVMNIEMDLFPNPTRGKVYLYIDAPAFRLVWLTLYNCNGQVLQNRQVQIPNNLEMNLHDLTPGVYLVRVTDGKEVLTKRVMRQR